MITAFCLLCTLSAAAQLTGTFYLDKTTFAPGEPIFLHFKVTNPGHQQAMISTMGLPHQPGCSGYSIDISHNSSSAPSCQRVLFSNPFDWCNYNGPLSAQMIEPGKSVTQRILLNLDADLNTPGEYAIHAKYFNLMGGVESKLDTEAKLHLRVDRSAPSPTRASFQPWVDRLHSRNEWKRAEAAEVLADVAPRSLETVLLGFAHDPDLKGYAPLALRRLNTPRSRAALAALLKGRAANEQQQAAMYLAETGDQKWLPLLLDLAKEYAADSWFPTAAAELGGDKAVPTLVSIEKSHDRAYAALNTVMALGYTRSRAAIPYLLEYLKSPETELAGRADGSLQMLTHRRASAGQKDATSADYAKWSRWWNREGATAPIYKANDLSCAPFQPLP